MEKVHKPITTQYYIPDWKHVGHGNCRSHIEYTMINAV
jgi:hypothetical protein